MGRLIQALSALCLFCSHAAIAQMEYPRSTIEITVPFSAGGAVDVTGRVTADILSKNLNRSFVVVNRPGANSNTGNQFVARAGPDGLSLLVTSIGLAANKALYKNLNYDPLTSFAPVSLISNAPVGLFVNSSLPVNNLQEFIAYLKENPGKLNYASYGIGSSPHLATELFQFITGTKMVHVPFTGNGPATIATIQNTTQVIFCTTVAAGPFVQEGSLKALGYADTQRAQQFPAIPTFIEQGVAFEMGTWFGLLAPAGTSPELINLLHGALKKGVSQPATVQLLASQGAEPVASTPTEFRDFLTGETKRLGELIRSAGIQAQ